MQSQPNGQAYAAPNGPPPQQYGQQPPQEYNQAPPTYGQNYGPQGGYGEKPTFDQAFKIDKPKWNDLWAGILFLAVCAGFVAVSGISIQGYGRQYRFAWYTDIDGLQLLPRASTAEVSTTVATISV